MKLICSATKKGFEFEVFLEDDSLVGKINGAEHKVTNSKVEGKYCFRFYGVESLVGAEAANIVSETAKEMFLDKVKENNEALYKSKKMLM